MRTLHLASLADHIVVEEGDFIYPPGVGIGGVVYHLGTEKVTLGFPAHDPTAFVGLGLAAAGLVMMDDIYLQPRPEGAVDHTIQT